MYWVVKDVIPYLDESKISYSIDGTSIRVPLPNNFGTLVIGDVDNEYDIIDLEGEDWHTHLHRSDKIFEFIKDIFEGNELLIEIIKDGKPAWRDIICKCHLACFKEVYEEEGITIKIYNLI